MDEGVLLNAASNGTKFLLEIEQMPPGNPLTFLEAMKKVDDAYGKEVFGEPSDAARGIWISRNWVEWLQGHGYQVLLTGSEWLLIPDVQKPEKPEEESPIIKLEVELRGVAVTLITTRERPPIRHVRVIGASQIEIHYETGEQESAHLKNDYYWVRTLIEEVVGGNTSLIQPFKWSA